MSDAMVPKAKLTDVKMDGKVLQASYNGTCITLSPAQTHREFYREVSKLNAPVNRVAELRRDHEAARVLGAVQAAQHKAQAS